MELTGKEQVVYEDIARIYIVGVFLSDEVDHLETLRVERDLHVLHGVGEKS